MWICSDNHYILKFEINRPSLTTNNDNFNNNSDSKNVYAHLKNENLI